MTVIPECCYRGSGLFDEWPNGFPLETCGNDELFSFCKRLHCVDNRPLAFIAVTSIRFISHASLPSLLICRITVLFATDKTECRNIRAFCKMTVIPECCYRGSSLFDELPNGFPLETCGNDVFSHFAKGSMSSREGVQRFHPHSLPLIERNWSPLPHRCANVRIFP